MVLRRAEHTKAMDARKATNMSQRVKDREAVKELNSGQEYCFDPEYDLSDAAPG